MLAINAINASNAFEYALGLIGVLGALTSFIFFLANMKIRAVTDQRLLSMAERQQRRYDRVKVILTLQASRIKDIENFLGKDGFFKRTEFPEQGLPSEDTEL